MTYVYYTILGLAPSTVWLLFYLKKDSHPEPRRMILKIFALGALMGPAAILVQLATRWCCQPTFVWSNFFAGLGHTDYRYMLNIVLFAPLSEEFLKYAVVRWQALRNPAFDEPLDAMIYLIVSALGFAAVENLLSIFLAPDMNLRLAVSQSVARFLSATFLHTLSSGIFGFFIGLSLLNFKRRRFFWLAGFLLAVVFHSFYNYLAYLLDSQRIYIVPLVLLLSGAIFLVTWQFSYLKKQLSVCKLR